MVRSLSSKRRVWGQLSTEAFTVIVIERGKRVKRNRKKSVARKVTKGAYEFYLFLFPFFAFFFFFSSGKVINHDNFNHRPCSTLYYVPLYFEYTFYTVLREFVVSNRILHVYNGIEPYQCSLTARGLLLNNATCKLDGKNVACCLRIYSDRGWNDTLRICTFITNTVNILFYTISYIILNIRNRFKMK